VFGQEEVTWRPVGGDYGPRSRRRLDHAPYMAAVPPAIEHADLVLDGPTTALVTEAAAAVARFDSEVGAAAAPFEVILLRSEAASSSQIERLTASAKAIAAAEIGQKGRANAEQIVANAEAMRTAAAWSGPLDAGAILAIHGILMTPTLGEQAGRLRGQPVWIGGSSWSPHGAHYVPPTAPRLPDAIADLLAFMARDDIASLAQVAVSHAQFEAIHPFVDGNGRTGRALIHAQLRRAGLSANAALPISAGLLASSGRYFEALDAYRQGDPAPIVVELASAVFPAVTAARALVARVAAAREGWRRRLTARADAAAWRLVDLVAEHPVVGAGFVADSLGIGRANAVVAIGHLVAAGALEQIGSSTRNRLWQAPEVLAAMDHFAAAAGPRR
jgi:Fic family protein